MKPEFFRNHRLFRAEVESSLPLRLGFEGLWTCADREGRFKWHPEELKLDVLPYDEIDFSRVLDALATRHFIYRYEVAGESYGVIPSFKRHQVINNREGASILPAPPPDSPSPIVNDISTRDPRVDDACPTPLVQASVEGEGKDESRNGNHACHTRERFDRFWGMYPRKDGSKKRAFELFCKIDPDESMIVSWSGWIERAARSTQWSQADKIPHATTWLSERRWEADPPPRGNSTSDRVGLNVEEAQPLDPAYVQGVREAHAAGQARHLSRVSCKEGNIV